MDQEMYKDVSGYEGLYQVSNFGSIKSLLFNKKHILKPGIYKNGRLYVNLWKNNKYKHFQIHRLVLEAFIGPCPLRMECRHLDGNPKNNKLDNLLWDTHFNNNQDKIKHGTLLLGSKCSWSKLNESDVKNIRKLINKNQMTQEQIATIFNIHQSTISDIKRKKRWKHLE